MIVLLQFVYQACFGLALAMSITSPELVTSGYYRNHLYVILGLNVLAAAVAGLNLNPALASLWPPIVIACLAYVGSVFWLYEKPRGGRMSLTWISILSLAAAWMSQPMAFPGGKLPTAALVLKRLDPPTGGMVLGFTLAAMFLGHWYLNAPGMKLDPLRRLVLGMGAAILLRWLVAAVSLGCILATTGAPGQTDMLFISLRWLSGLIGALGLTWMTWQTLKVPNTQSATGILYVAVIVTFIGELTSQLLGARLGYPV